MGTCAPRSVGRREARPCLEGPPGRRARRAPDRKIGETWDLATACWRASRKAPTGSHTAASPSVGWQPARPHAALQPQGQRPGARRGARRALRLDRRAPNPPSRVPQAAGAPTHRGAPELGARRRRRSRRVGSPRAEFRGWQRWQVREPRGVQKTFGEDASSTAASRPGSRARPDHLGPDAGGRKRAMLRGPLWLEGPCCARRRLGGPDAFDGSERDRTRGRCLAPPPPISAIP
jgi:hypothetical protein